MRGFFAPPSPPHFSSALMSVASHWSDGWGGHVRAPRAPGVGAIGREKVLALVRAAPGCLPQACSGWSWSSGLVVTSTKRRASATERKCESPSLGVSRREEREVTLCPLECPKEQRCWMERLFPSCSLIMRMCNGGGGRMRGPQVEAHKLPEP